MSVDAAEVRQAPERDPLFDSVVTNVLKREGGYKKWHDSLGGETKYGIAGKYHKGIDIKGLTPDAAKDIYYKEYWKPIHAGAFPPAVSEVLFDFAVHSGPGNAVKLLQRMLGVEATGKVNDETVQQAKVMSYKAGMDRFIDAYQYGRRMHLKKAADRNPELMKIYKGLQRRVDGVTLDARNRQSDSLLASNLSPAGKTFDHDVNDTMTLARPPVQNSSKLPQALIDILSAPPIDLGVGRPSGPPGSLMSQQQPQQPQQAS